MCRDLEEAASKWKPKQMRSPVGEVIKKRVKNLTQEGDLLKNHSKMKVNSNRVEKRASENYWL